MEKLKEYLEELKNKIITLKENNEFLQLIFNGKNFAIIILSFLLFCNIIAYSYSDSYKNHSQIEELTKQTEDLKALKDELNSELTDNSKTIEDLNSKLDNQKNDIKSLQDINKILQDEKTKLESEKQTLETEKENLNKEIEQLKTSKANNSSISKSSTTSSYSKASNSTPTTSGTNTNSAIVFITNTGTKYHRDGCSYLRKSKIQTTLSDAQNRGYTPCSRCF